MEDNAALSGLELLKDAPVAPGHVIGAIALNMAMKYHDISTVKDGTLYQQYKLEGKNMRELHIDIVFETAIMIERHLLGASDRIAKLVFDAIAEPPEETEADELSGERTTEP